MIIITKKRQSPIYFIILFSILFISLISLPITAQLNRLSDIENKSGGVNPETGLPTKLDPLAKTGEKLTEGEITTEYLKQEWQKIFEKSKFGKYFIGFLNFTEKIFAFFNPLWEYTFGTEFSWSWSFFLSLLIWVSIIILLYSPSKAFTEINPLFTLIFAIVVASLAGSGGIISKATEILADILTNFWLVGIATLIAVIILIVYYKFFGDMEKDLKKESEEEKLKRAKENIKAHGDVSGKALDEMAGKK